jgi:hypothetical protein
MPLDTSPNVAKEILCRLQIVKFWVVKISVLHGGVPILPVFPRTLPVLRPVESSFPREQRRRFSRVFFGILKYVLVNIGGTNAKF